MNFDFALHSEKNSVAHREMLEWARSRSTTPVGSRCGSGSCFDEELVRHLATVAAAGIWEQLEKFGVDLDPQSLKQPTPEGGSA